MRVAPALIALCLFTSALTASAEPPDDATRATARKIAQEGLDLYDAGKFADALDRFTRADAMVHAPTLLLMAGRSLVKLGRLVEAADRFAAASQMPLGADASDTFRQAVADAAKERAALLPRIPSVAITVDAPAGSQVAVTIDGKPVAVRAADQKELVDPGRHTIEATLGGEVARSSVTLVEGETRAVGLAVGSGSPRSMLRTTGWIAAGTGAAGLVLGAVTGGLALAKKGELDDAGCKDALCPTEVGGDMSTYNTLRLVSGAGFIAGAVTLAGGVALILATPETKVGRTGLTVAPFVGAGSVGARGTF